MIVPSREVTVTIQTSVPWRLLISFSLDSSAASWMVVRSSAVSTTWMTSDSAKAGTARAKQMSRTRSKVRIRFFIVTPPYSRCTSHMSP